MPDKSLHLSPENQSLGEEWERSLYRLIEDHRQSGVWPGGASWADSWENLAEELRNSRVYWLTDGANKCLGFCCLRPGNDHWDLHLIVVDKAYEGRGLAQSLLKQAMGELPQLWPVWLEVHRDNQRAKSLYKKLGFSRVGARKDYYGKAQEAELYTYNLLPFHPPSVT